jgi:cobalt-zinc-cadmium efflux system outer membrane protein
MRFLLLLLLFLGLFARWGQAQQSPAGRELSLQQARHLAEQVSPELASARAAVRVAEGRARQAGAFPNPVASYSREQTSGSGIETSQDIIALEQALELGGQRGARRAAARELITANQARLAGARSQLWFDVTRAYAQAVAADRRATLTDQAAQVFGEAGRVGRERLAAGDISGYEHRRIRLESARYAALRAEAGLARAKARRTLATLLSAPDRPVESQALVLTDTIPGNRLQVSPDSMAGLALAHRPDLVALEREAAAAEAEARLARAERIPTPTLGGGYKREQAPGGGSLDGYTAQLSLPLPLWDRRGGAVQAADAERERRQADRAALRRRTELEVREAYDAYQTLGSQLNALGSRIQEDARPGIRAAQAAYREGETSLIEWLDAVRAFHEAESTYAALAAEHTIQRATLERLTGLTLF